MGLTVGIGGNNFVFTSYNSNFKEYFLWEIRPEFYFIHNPGRRISMYNSIELFYINEDDVILNSSFITERDNTIHFDKANYNRQKIGAVVNFGVFIPFTSHFGMNVYAGMGIKWRINEYSNIINPVLQPGYSEYFWRSYFKKEGLKIGFEPNFGIKLNLILQ